MIVNTLPAGQYKPRDSFYFDGRQWVIYAVAHTGKTLQAVAHGYPWRDETFSIEEMENAE